MDTKLAAEDSRPQESVKILYDYELLNCPGKSIVAVEVAIPPNGRMLPHTHAGAAVFAIITEGKVLTGLNGDPPRVYTVGEHYIEQPGWHHTVGENASAQAPAKIVATVIVDTEVIRAGAYHNLVMPDEGQYMVEREKL